MNGWENPDWEELIDCCRETSSHFDEAREEILAMEEMGHITEAMREECLRILFEREEELKIHSDQHPAIEFKDEAHDTNIYNEILKEAKELREMGLDEYKLNAMSEKLEKAVQEGTISEEQRQYALGTLIGP